MYLIHVGEHSGSKINTYIQMQIVDRNTHKQTIISMTE